MEETRYARTFPARTFSTYVECRAKWERGDREGGGGRERETKNFRSGSKFREKPLFPLPLNLPEFWSRQEYEEEGEEDDKSINKSTKKSNLPREEGGKKFQTDFYLKTLSSEKFFSLFLAIDKIYRREIYYYI